MRMLVEPFQTTQSRIDDLHASGTRPNSTKPNARFARFRNSPKQHKAECQLSVHPEPNKTGFEAPQMASFQIWIGGVPKAGLRGFRT